MTPSSRLQTTATPVRYSLSLHDALPIYPIVGEGRRNGADGEQQPLDLLALVASAAPVTEGRGGGDERQQRSEEHTSELQSRQYLVCRLLLEKNIEIYIDRATLNRHIDAY